MKLRFVAQLVGVVCAGLALTMLVPVAVAWYDGATESVQAYAGGALIALATGLALRYGFARGPRAEALGPREAIGVVGVSWILAGILGGVPLLLDGAVSSPIDALFESVSGLTTTGATILPVVEEVSRATLMWRSMCHWLGGIGIIVLFVAVFPQLGVGARHLLSSEVPGPITERLRPRLRQTAVTLFWIYFTLTLALGICLWVAGMGLFDAANHCLSTLATGGFSTRTASVGAFDSPFIEWLTTGFMLLGGVNFGIYFAIWQGRGRQVFSDTELKAYLGFFLLATLFICGAILDANDGDLGTALRHAAFQVAAVQTTTGFGTDDYDAYPQSARMLLFATMFVGGCAGSTAGGMKVSRILVLAKAAARELARTIRPSEVRVLRVGRTVIPEETLRSIAGFATLFVLTYVVAVLVLASLGLDFETAASAAVAALCSIGPGLGPIVGPTGNYATLPELAKVVLIACMLLGRLEVATMMALVMPALWRRR